ncbi:enoyl-CoA hydratase-related protein [Gemmobacter serpentinus]|uniref:enoyl-CoA hydratase-related protein n=1 Tax=Gemmobacter serpentinus TaxID=2652247 RepID=UPI00124F649F|nr:enoyl-CoA hydratase-related protein [Gemmobacter serpentinus]
MGVDTGPELNGPELTEAGLTAAELTEARLAGASQTSASQTGAGLVMRHDAGAIAVLRVDAPPVNALDRPLRQSLTQAITEAVADAGVAGIVLAAHGAGFPGSDLAAFDMADAADLSVLCDLVEAAPKPVVVALHGAVTSGGIALALAARGRVAQAEATFGLPEVTLGLVPAAGVTQRLPRLIGAEQSLRLALTGQPVAAAEALALGLLDRVVEDGLDVAAIDLARQLVEVPGLATSERRDGMRDPATFQKAVNSARSRLKTQTGRGGARLPAPARIVDCIEAAHLLPFAAGLSYEAAACEDMAASAEAAGLRHALHAERRATRFAETRLRPRPELVDLRRVGILGAAAADLALPLLQAGCEVALVDPRRPQLVQALEKVAAMQERAIAEGRMTAAQRDLDWARLGTALSAAGLAECQAVLIADVDLMPEAMEATLPGTLLAMIGRGGVQPQGRGADILGFRPAGARLVELVVTPVTAAAQVLQGQALARLLGLAVLRSAMPGGVPGRVMAAGRAAVAHMLAQGEAAADLALTLADFGLPGLVPQLAEPSKQPAARPGPATARRIETRVLGAMANEAARLLGQGLVAEAAEIDFALVAGQGFPRWQGGPLFWADRRGLMILRRDLEAWGPEAPEIWGIAPLLAELAGRGDRFASLG